MTVTLTFGQGHQMTHLFEGLHTDYLLVKSHNSTVNSVWDIVKNYIISKFLVNTMTLTKGQGHPMPHYFQDLCTCYLFAKNHNFTVNNVWDIVKNYQKVDIFQISIKYCDLDQMSRSPKVILFLSSHRRIPFSILS